MELHTGVIPSYTSVMLASSVQAALTGRFEGSEYGKSKLAGEELFFQYGNETGAKVLPSIALRYGSYRLHLILSLPVH